MSPTSRPHARLRVYVSAAGSGEIHVLAADPAATALRPSQVVALGGAPMPMAISPDRRRLYAIDRKGPHILHSLAIDPDTGHLSPLHQMPLSHDLVQAAVSPDGRHLYGASYSQDLVACHAIDADGAARHTVQVLPTARQAHTALPSPDGREVWVTCLGADQLNAHAVAPDTGQLSPAPDRRHHCLPGSGPRHLAWHPNGRWLLLVHELDGRVEVLDTGVAGAPVTLGQASLLPEDAGTAPWAAELRVAADGQWVLASDRRAAVVSALRIDARTGALQRVASIATDPMPRSLALSPDGRAVYVASQTSGQVQVLAFDADTGALRLAQQLACGRAPTWVEALNLPG